MDRYPVWKGIAGLDSYHQTGSLSSLGKDPQAGSLSCLGPWEGICGLDHYPLLEVITGLNCCRQTASLAVARCCTILSGGLSEGSSDWIAIA
jgi:hypothetical protein